MCVCSVRSGVLEINHRREKRELCEAARGRRRRAALRGGGVNTRRVQGSEAEALDQDPAAEGRRGTPDEDRLCFPTKEFAAVKVSTAALVFDGVDAAIELNVKNYFFKVAGSDQTYLSICPSTGGSVLGSLLQTGRNMTYDIRDDGRHPDVWAGGGHGWAS